MLAPEEDLEKQQLILGHKPRPFDAFAQQAAYASGAWNSLNNTNFFDPEVQRVANQSPESIYQFMRRLVDFYNTHPSGATLPFVQQDKDEDDTRALVLLSASSGFPNGISVLCQKGLALLAEGAAGHARQLLLIWPDGSEVIVEDSLREERYTLRRTGDQFDPVRLH